ncbi:MAG: DUF4091 domain-containing protein [Arachnia propionica]|uniref:glycoside hydrolase domain-containing protein n=1 Tax=Arachnia propionica TaxID=1750 RepID=UPI0026F4F07B|nr:DUF4091 domain-containing protein [Arachnia propionica]
MTAQFRLLSPLAHVLPSGPVGPGLDELTAWGGEPARFLVAWRLPATRNSRAEALFRLEIDAPGCRVEISRAELVPVQIPHFEGNADGFVVDSPTLLPDPLIPVTSATDASQVTLRASHLGWHCLHVVLWPSCDATVTVTGSLVDEWDGSVTRLGRTGVPLVHALDRLEVAGPSVTQWVHPDCLLHVYDVSPFSEEHWSAIGAHLRCAAEMGVTGTIAPLWAPALDTAEGSYRPDVQLLGITCSATGAYTFDADRARRFLLLMVEAGMRHVETPPLFTQWGARHAPPIRVAYDGAEPGLRFGWHTPADDEAYLAFLDQLLPFVHDLLAEFPQLKPFVHISDEPDSSTAERFAAVRRRLKEALGDLPTLDALSDPGFRDLVDEPVVATDAVPRWQEVGVEPNWVYHCVIQADLANRFIAMEPSRIRMLGLQMFTAGATGFLHWGFDFYFHALSRNTLDPWQDTSAGGCFPSGDAFVVYPGPGLEPVRSLRWWQIRDAFRDWALFTHATELLGRERVVAMLTRGQPMDYTTFLDATTYEERRHVLIERLTLEERIADDLLLSRARVAADPTLETVRKLSTALHQAAQLALTQDHRDEAEAYYQEFLTHIRSIRAQEDGIEARIGLSVALTELATLAEEREDWGKAREFYMEVLELTRTIALEDPTPETQHDLQVALDDVGDAAAELGDWASAATHHGESVTIARTVFASHPSEQSQIDLAVGLRNLSRATAHLGLVGEARRLAVEARDLAAPLGRPDLLAWVEELLE